MSYDFTISDGAVKKLKELLQKESDPEATFLRVRVDGGGCSGFQYFISFDTKRNDDDIEFQREGVKVLVDEPSLGIINGSELHYKQELVGSMFVINNPNAAQGCGCGSSFSI